MHERPDHFRQHCSVPGPHIARSLAAPDHAFDHSEGSVGGRAAGGAAFHEHHLIIGAALLCESKVSNAHCVQPHSETFLGIAVPGCFERIREIRKASLADGVKKLGFVGKMPVWSRARNPRPFPYIPQRQAANTLFLNQLSPFSDEDFAQIPVMISDSHEMIITKRC